jgi:hypothetical protein
MSKNKQNFFRTYNKMLSGLRKAAGKVGRFLSTTGKSALRKVGDTAQSIRKVGGAINEATGGAAGAAFEASKSLVIPGIGVVTRNLEKGLEMAEKASSAGLKAIDIGERGVKAAKSKNLAGAKAAYGDASKLYKSLKS